MPPRSGKQGHPAVRLSAWIASLPKRYFVKQASLSAPLFFALCPLLAGLLPLLLPIARNFEYEYATLSAYAVLLLYGIMGLALPLPRAPLARPWLVLSGLAAPLLASLPAWIAFRGGFCLCGERDFWMWWVMQFGPHLLWGQLSFLVLLKWRQGGQTRRFCAFVALGLLIALLLHLSATLWLQPQKRTTHLLAGFIHGAIYDTWIPIDPGIILSRGTHALLALSMAALLLPQRHLHRIVAIPLLLLSFFNASRAMHYPSQSHGRAALEALMPLKRSGERFTLHYRDLDSKILASRLDDLFAAATFHMRDLSQKLLVYDTHVHIFVYPSREEKKLWFGGDGTDITDVVTPSIHINLESWPHSTLRHELVHALASSFAFHGLGFHPNLAFTEGLAVALAPEEEEMSLHAGAASLLQSGRILHPESLFSPLFWSESGRRAYTMAGSIIKFLLDHYGITKVKDLYAGHSWESIFASDASAILDQWQKFLNANYPPATESIAAETLFRYPGILEDVCPHTKSLFLRTNEDPLIARRQPIAWDPDLSYWDWRLSLAHEDESQLAAMQAKVSRLWEKFKPEEAANLLLDIDRLRRDPPHSLEDIEYFVLKIDLLVALEQYAAARTETLAAIQKLRAYRIGDNLQRQLWVRMLLLEEPLAEARPWLRLLAGIDRNVPSWQASFKAWVVKYLFVRNSSIGSNQLALLRRFSEEEVPEGLPATFAVEWQRTIGLQWMRSKNYPEAEKAFLKAAALAPEAKRDALTLYAIEARDRQKWAH